MFLGCYGSSLSGDGLGSGRRERFLISAVRGGDGVSSPGQETQTLSADLELMLYLKVSLSSKFDIVRK